VPDDFEWCDARDNDCDARIDEGHVCPDSTIRNTLPNDMAVWARGWQTPSDSSTRGIQRLWPTEGPVIPLGATDSYHFDSDDRLHFTRDGQGVRRFSSPGVDEEVATPPCFNLIQGFYGFDASSRPYYTCDRTFRRGIGELVFDGHFYVNAVLASGLFVRAYSPDTQVLDHTGTAISRVAEEEWVGPMEALQPVTVVGDSAFVTFNRSHRGTTRRELVVYRLDGDGGVFLVRRTPTPHAMRSAVALPDGHIIGLRYSSDLPESGLVFSFPPAGPTTVLRDNRPGNELLFGGHGPAFLPGPRAF
jgi:hypothetical protein